MDSAGGNRRQLTRVPEGIREAILSGDGKIAYAITEAGRILRILVATAEVREVIPRTPVIDGPGNIVRRSPGSLIWLQGAGLSDTTLTASPPLPNRLGGVELQLNGSSVPLLAVSPAEIRFQIPFEASLGQAVLNLLTGDSPFEALR